MNTWDFNNCRAFLEFMIQERPENTELVKAYITLIEKKTEYDISINSDDADFQKNRENNQKELSKNWQDNQTTVTTESIKQGIQNHPNT